MRPLLNFVNHSKCQFDLAHTLEQLPAEWPLHTVRRFVSNSLRMSNSKQYQTSMAVVLSLSQLERVKQQKQALFRKPIYLDKDRYICQLIVTIVTGCVIIFLPLHL